MDFFSEFWSLLETIMTKEQITLESPIAIIDDVVSRELDGEAIILNLESGTYFGLDPVGTRIWSLLQENHSVRKICELVQQEYEVPPERLEGDILRLLEDLRVNGLLRVFAPAEGQPTHA
jgi:Coenzyme PQQ synthesis protein D (PqqD)